jgi:hypothetical protein
MLPSDNTRNESYGDFMNVPQQMGNAFGEVLQNTPEQDPRQVALAIAELIEKPAEKRPFRTIVDFMPWKMEFKNTMNIWRNSLKVYMQLLKWEIC